MRWFVRKGRNNHHAHGAHFDCGSSWNIIYVYGIDWHEVRALVLMSGARFEWLKSCALQKIVLVQKAQWFNTLMTCIYTTLFDSYLMSIAIKSRRIATSSVPCVFVFIFFPFWTHKPFEITVARNDWKSVIFNGRQLPVCVDYYNYAVWKDPRNDGFWAFQMIDRLDHYVLTIFDEKFSMSMVFYFVVQAHFFSTFNRIHLLFVMVRPFISMTYLKYPVEI